MMMMMMIMLQEVGRAALVCRSWRDAALGEAVMGRVAASILPVLGQGAAGRGWRKYMAAMGRCLLERRVWVGDEWPEGLRLHFEVRGAGGGA
jgi:hypothetical protein